MSQPKSSSKKSEARRCESVVSRRHFLRGTGITLALPTFMSLLPRGTRAQEDRPQRLLTLYHPNGMPKTLPQARALDATVDSDLTERFERYASRMSVAKHMNSNGHKAQTGNYTGHPHMSCFLSLYNGDRMIRYGNEQKTFDQYIAEDPRHQGSARSSVAINLGIKTESQLGVAPVYFNSLSWKGAGQPIAPFADPRRLFEDLFGRGGEGASNAADEAARQALLERRQLFLDVAMDQAHSLRRRMGRSDQLRLDEYLSGVAELDRRTQQLREMRMEIEAACSADGAPMPVIEGESVRVPYELYPETLGVMQDIIVRAFQCDATRVASFAHSSVAGGGFFMRQPWVADLIEGRMHMWHALSHFFDATNLDPDLELNRRDFKVVIKWHYDRMVEFLDKLQATPGTWGGDSLLDETLVAMGTSMDYPGHSCGMLHQNLVGSANGAFNEGVVVDAGFDRESGTANLWLTVLKGFGIDIDRYGASNGLMEGLLA